MILFNPSSFQEMQLSVGFYLLVLNSLLNCIFERHLEGTVLHILLTYLSYYLYFKALNIFICKYIHTILAINLYYRQHFYFVLNLDVKSLNIFIFDHILMSTFYFNLFNHDHYYFCNYICK